MQRLMKSRRPLSLIAAGVLATLALQAQATTVYEGSMTITASSPLQLGRLYRGGVPQSWAGGEAWPTWTNATTSFHYTTLTLDLTALMSGYEFGQYLQISIDSPTVNTFLAGYLNTYDPTSAGTVQATWLGDTGLSGPAFNVDVRTFQVKVPQGGNLVLVLSEAVTNGGLDIPAGILVESFADDSYTDLSPVPEPASWAYLGLGVAALGVRRLRAARGAV